MSTKIKIERGYNPFQYGGVNPEPSPPVVPPDGIPADWVETTAINAEGVSLVGSGTVYDVGGPTSVVLSIATNLLTNNSSGMVMVENWGTATIDGVNYFGGLGRPFVPAGWNGFYGVGGGINHIGEYVAAVVSVIPGMPLSYDFSTSLIPAQPITAFVSYWKRP